MSLFQNSVLNKYLKELPFDEVESVWEKFKNHFHNADIQENIRNSKEEQYQGEFLIDLFVKVFGYVKNPAPNFNLTTELKNVKDSKKADGAILKNDEAIGVIELKGTNTIDLAKIETQAFGYKNNHPKCVYIITSNFEKLRFYIDNAVEFEEFNLFNLDRKSFDILWLCLSAENLLKDVPKKIKNESLSEGELITKKLYKDYSNFRNEIFSDIVKINPNYNKLTLFQKTQKLLDRFLFILFAEDKSLLPPNSTEIIIKDWKDLRDRYDEYFPLYDRFKKYFGYLNEGYKGKKHDIFAYNGGLFLPDEVLDNIKIGDELLSKHTKILSNYDFASEVSVNILGHIFEHSLTEIESIQAELAGEEIDKSKTKRKKDGVFYTPTYITKYIVDNTIGKLCIAKKAELEINEDDYEKLKGRRTTTIEALRKKLDAYREWLLKLTICDPACGSGAFLNQALEFLIAEHSYIDELYTNLEGFSLPLTDLENSILENNLFGVDINEESVEIAKLSLWLRTAQKGRKLTTLNDNIKCGNSLIDDPEIAGEKAFVWKDEFPKVFANGGFDVVIGNPPYVFAREKISQSEKDFYSKNYNSADYQVNTYLLFIEKAIKLIKQNGAYGLIVPNAWLMIYSGEGLRKYILKTSKVNQVINLEGYSFEGVNVETIILLAEKKSLENNEIDILLSKGKEFVFSHKRKQSDFSENEGFEFRLFSDEESLSLTKKIQTDSVELDSIVQIKAGLQAYEKGKGIPKQTAEDVKNRPYDYDFKFDESTYKYLDGKDVGRYFISWEGQFLRYGDHLAAPRTIDLFDGKKIIVREITGKYPQSIISTYDDKLYLYNRSNIAIIERPEKSISLKYILVILNSSLISYYFVKNTAKSVRKMFPKIILNDLRLFPFKEIEIENQQPFIEKADKILTKSENLKSENNKFLTYLQSQFPIEKFSKKLQNWHELEFGEFINELNKAINKTDGGKLTKSDEMEWMELFETKKEIAQAIKSEIDKTDGEIDQMVYELYGLTDDEITIVEKGVG
ncbi:MAG: Eco57I restriction-modification methylase domain-containing protein [Aridibacter sp.]